MYLNAKILFFFFTHSCNIVFSCQQPNPVESWLASEPQEKCVAAFFTVHWVIFIIEVQDVFLRLKAELLIQQHGWVAGGNVKGDVLPHARLHRDKTSLSDVMQQITDVT